MAGAWRRTEAPLKENLAAAVLLRGGWPKGYHEGGGLLDLMCGSGTLLIEGALMAADVAPGLQRHGQAVPSRWRGFDRGLWEVLVNEARGRERIGRAGLRPVFHGSDLDPRAIANARENAQVAGVSAALHLEVRDIASLPAPPQATAWRCAIRPMTNDWRPTPRCTAAWAMPCAGQCRPGAPACCAATSNWRRPPACARPSATSCSTAPSNAPRSSATPSPRRSARPRPKRGC